MRRRVLWDSLPFGVRHHLASDPTERRERSAAEPARLAALRQRLAAHEAAMAAPAWPSLIEGAVLIDKPLGVPQAADDEYVYWDN